MSSSPHLSPSARLLDQVRERIRVKHYSIRTEQAYTDWIRRFILFHGKQQPATLGAPGVEAFLTHLAIERDVAAATQTRLEAHCSFFTRMCSASSCLCLDGVENARTLAWLPVVLTWDEVARILRELKGTHALIGRLLYGSGMRIMECVRLRVKDVDFARFEIVVRDGKGAKDRITMLPRGVTAPLRAHLHDVWAMHQRDLTEGFGGVYLPHALHRKFPDAPKAWGWQYVFPAGDRSRDPRTDALRRHHLSDQSFQRAVRQAVRDAGLTKPASPHTLRHYLPFLTMSRDANGSAATPRIC